jgi:hypothetical protein
VCERKFINWLVEFITSCEMCECGWKFINWLVEVISKCELKVGIERRYREVIEVPIKITVLVLLHIRIL